MQRGALVLVAAVGAAFVAAMVHAEPSQAQVRKELPRATETSELEKRIAVLEQQNAELRRFILVSGENLTIKTPQALKLEAGTTFEARGSTTVAVRAGAEGLFESGGVARIKGGIVRLNGGTKPLARVGDSVQVAMPGGTGKVVQGSATVLAD